MAWKDQDCCQICGKAVPADYKVIRRATFGIPDEYYVCEQHKHAWDVEMEYIPLKENDDGD